MNPIARRRRLLTQPVGNELIVYDQSTAVAHRLNATAAAVWRLSDGRRSVDEIAGALTEAGLPGHVDLVGLALEQLDAAGLLASPADRREQPTRREALKTYAEMLPAVASVVSPSLLFPGAFSGNPFGWSFTQVRANPQGPSSSSSSGPSTPGLSFVIRDTDFPNTNWNASLGALSGNVTEGFSRQVEGNYAYRRMEHDHFSNNSSITVLHRYIGNNQTFEFANRVVLRIEYSAEHAFVGNPNDFDLNPTVQVEQGFLLFQNNQMFTAMLPSFRTDRFAWARAERTLTATDFVGPNNSNPNFGMNSAPLNFGFFRRTTAAVAGSGTESSQLWEHGIRDLTITVSYQIP